MRADAGHVRRLGTAFPAPEPLTPPHQIVILRTHPDQRIEAYVGDGFAAAALQPHGDIVSQPVRYAREVHAPR